MYKKVMIVVDEGEVAHSALAEGLTLAKSHRAQVLFFHVLPNYVMPVADATPLLYVSPEQYQRAVKRLASRILDAAAAEAHAKQVASSGAVGSDVDAATCIANAAAEHECDLIVVGSHGRNAMQRLIFGSVVTRLVTLAPVPLLVCKPTEHKDDPAQVRPAAKRARKPRAAPPAA